jgi:protein arginine N-methyltransferase 7
MTNPPIKNDFFGDHLSNKILSTIPNRLKCCKTSLIETVNDWHFAMVNDIPRNEFFWKALKQAITPDSIVLDIGTGSGLLAMLAVHAGAKHVFTIEASPDLHRTACQIILDNEMQNKITCINKLSTDLVVEDFQGMQPTILLSEILGTLLESECGSFYITDVHKRLIKFQQKSSNLPKPIKIIPERGIQYLTIIECPSLNVVSTEIKDIVTTYPKINLSTLEQLRDTCSLKFTKNFGFRLSSCQYRIITQPIVLFEIDYTKTTNKITPLSKTFRFKVPFSCTIHAAMFSWEVRSYSDVLTTHPWDTKDNLARDMHWGQALQLLEDKESNILTGISCKAEEFIEVNVRLSDLYVSLKRLK